MPTSCTISLDYLKQPVRILFLVLSGLNGHFTYQWQERQTESPVHIGSTGCSCHLVRGDDVHRRIKLTECMSGTRLEVKLGEQRQALSSPGGWKFSGCNCETVRQYSSCPTFPIFCLLGSTQNPSTVTQNLK